MKDTLRFLNEIVPEAMELLKNRYAILSAIQFNQPVGRRALAEKLKASERVLRKELEFMHRGGLLTVSTAGVSLTDKALEALQQAQYFVREALGLTLLEERLAVRLGLDRMIIVPGDSDEDRVVLLNMGRAAAQLLSENLKPQSVVAVTGGWTVAGVAGMVNGHFPGVTVVPARGGLGEKVETQANTIAARLAERLGGSHKMLHIPESLDPKALESLLNDTRIKKTVAIIRSADILLYGIGRADIMARRRGLNSNNRARLLTKGAVSEALGNYFNGRGELVGRAPSFGIEISDQPNLSLSLAVAGGSSKAEAIMAALRKSKGQVLVTDEGAAVKIERFLEDNPNGG
jgi:central glycolytic genes regulator